MSRDPKHSKLHLERCPNKYLVARDKGKWPDGRLRVRAPPEAHLMQALTKRLKAAMGGRTLREIEAVYGVNKSSLNKILRGRDLAQHADHHPARENARHRPLGVTSTGSPDRPELRPRPLRGFGGAKPFR